jgi:hypothetical protein
MSEGAIITLGYILSTAANDARLQPEEVAILATILLVIGAAGLVCEMTLQPVQWIAKWKRKEISGLWVLPQRVAIALCAMGLPALLLSFWAKS